MHARIHANELSLALRQVVDGIEIGIVLCDEGGSIAYVNRHGARHLADADALAAPNGILSATDAGCDTELRRQLAGPAAAGSSGFLARRSDGGRPLAVYVHLLAGAPDAPQSTQTSLRLVTIVDSAPGPAGSAPDLCAIHSLTPSEARLAESMLIGLQLAGAARQARVSINTVRTQLKQLFAKTATRRQSDLLRVLAASLPRFASRDRGGA